ncbi:lysis inhibition [Escherichia phage EcS1]|uniref:Lysis inhibition regulator membrane protein n=1 Tax=Escherichia phage EcS1 TaxID=2083276 RepID=A0A2Z5ZCH4_9CAUD|nr:lysis inhibition [Escherichia phage EcS1]BBC78164.1 Lysis inhibition regulator membrane protein [Escherichia phage EcS1]
MGLIRVLSTTILIGACLAPSVSSAQDASFNQYVEGALTVYSKFKEPSKQQSEKFFAFISAKWQEQEGECYNNCSIDGKSAGQEYANRMKVPLENEI